MPSPVGAALLRESCDGSRCHIELGAGSRHDNHIHGRPRTGHAPTSPTDGDVVSSQIAGSSSTDDSAPIASQVTYAIFATRDGSMFSDVVHTTILVLPAPTSLRSTADLTNVQISWECPSAAAGVVVTQQEPDGTTSDHEISHGSTLRVSSLTTGPSIASWCVPSTFWTAAVSFRNLRPPQ